MTSHHQNYFDKHKINFNIFDEIKDGNLILENNIKEENKYLGTRQDGVSNYDETKNKVVAKVIVSNTVFDSLVIVHELTHNRNKPIGNRNLTSDLLTESISYANEFIFAYEFLDKSDLSNYFKGIEKMLYSYADNLYLIYLKFLGSKLTEEEYVQLKEIDDAMLWYDLKNLLGELQNEEIPQLHIKPDYTIRPFKDVENEYLELFYQYSETNEATVDI